MNDSDSQLAGSSSIWQYSRRSFQFDKPRNAPNIPNEGCYPEGGVKAWLTVSGASCCLFASFGWLNSVGIFQDYYQNNQLKDCTSFQIAWIPSLQSK
jgi:hypothetical protein